MEQRVFMRSKVALHKENLTIEIEVFFLLFANKKRGRLMKMTSSFG